jgi:uncharacterized protein YndB with AHSA1/START domain
LSEIKGAATAVLKLEFPINASAERVWKVMTQETSRWWDKDFVSLPGSDGVKLEPHIGGKLYEETDDGRSLVWATVIAVTEGKSMDFVGYMTPEWTGPTMTMIKLAVEPTEGGSVLKITEGLLGRITDETMQSMTEGWTFLFGTKLKSFAEGVPVA